MVNPKKELLKKILAIVAIVVALLILYAPLIYMTVYSFTDASTNGTWSGFSTQNYVDLFSGKQLDAKKIWSAAKNTAVVALTASVISTILGTLGAIGINSLRNKHLKNTMNFATQIPIVNAEIVTGVSLCVFFLIFTNLFKIPNNFATLVIGHVVLTVPYVVISVTPKLEQMDPSLYEAALDLGATRTQALWKVIVPEIIPGVLSGFMLSLTLSLDDVVITEFTKPGDGFDTISTYIENELGKGTVPKQLRAFTALLFAVILLVIVGMFAKSSIDKKKQRNSSNKGELL